MSFEPEQIKKLQTELSQSDVMKHPSTGMSYVGGFYVIDKLNEVFGFDGWSYSIKNLTQDPDNRIVTAEVILAVYTDTQNITRHDVGVGIPPGNTSQAYETAVKAAVTDGLKRAARTFGSQFGNSLYDKESELHTGGAASEPKQQERWTGADTKPAYTSVKTSTNNAASGSCDACGANVPFTKYDEASLRRFGGGLLLCYKDSQAKKAGTLVMPGQNKEPAIVGGIPEGEAF